MEKLLIIDGNSIINRAFYALPLLSNKNGEYSNAVYGFVNILLRAINDISPTRIVVAFDYGKKTFRNNLYSEYKATRKATPEELKVQFPILKRMLGAMNIKLFEKEGVEADDIIGTIAAKTQAEKIILTGDKDSLQLIDDDTSVYLTKKGISEIMLMNKQAIKREMNLEPWQVVELKALMGDASDNIPGVKGIGEKTALALISEYGNIDSIYQNIDNIKGKVHENLKDGKEMAYLSKTLATIDKNVNIKFCLDDFKFDRPFNESVYEIFREYNFNSLLKRQELFRPDIKIEKTNKAKIEQLKEYGQIEDLLQKIKTAGAVTFEISNSINMSYDDKTEFVIAFEGNLLDQGLENEKVIEILKPVFEDEKIVKYLYDYKEQKHILSKFKTKLEGCKFDCMLAHYLIYAGDRPTPKHNLCEFYNLEKEFVSTNIWHLEKTLKNQLEEYSLNKLYYEVEFPLIEVLFDMETHGFKVDRKQLDELSDRYTAELSDLTKVIYMQAGEEFNLNSPKQLGVVLFEKLKLKAFNNKKNSTGIEILEELQDAHPIVPLIMRFRQVQKLNSTYVEAFKNISSGGDVVTKQQSQPTRNDAGFIHTIFNQTLTATGRLSSSEPNLQNIPIRSEEGKYLRKIFIPSTDDGWLVSADYSQIELRLLAHMSNDPNLINAYIVGKDIHTQTASEVFRVPFSEVTADMRRSAKAVNFGIIYGISDFGLSRGLGVPVKRAKEYIDTYFERYPSVKQYMDGNVEFAKKHGFVVSFLGRRRKINEILSSNYNLRHFGERAAMNMPLQGSASDIIKIAMVRVSQALKVKKLKSRLILQVHDELIVDTYKDELNAVITILKKEMEGALHLSVPLTVDVTAGKNLFECK
ncbi:MAG: DNA polymerase I [Christensenellaceae bacterium]|jgi:DNA polymerase-1|nr:DNA polymerase I [Christensenellaceae bacterium]